MPTPRIIARQLTKRYGERAAVDGLDLEVGAGEVFGLLGPNGAGKTTTILMLLGLVEPSGGSVEILGMDPSRHPLPVKRRVGYLPDAVGFYDTMTGRENLRFTARLNDLPAEEVEDRIEGALTEVGLTEAADRPAGTYSRGMLQRLGIADALLKDPAVLILDEPTTAIDPEGVTEILALIRRLADQRSVTVLLSSHLLHQVQAVCDRVAIFIRGRVVATGTPTELAAARPGPDVIEIGTDAETDLGVVLGGAEFVENIQRGRLPGVWRVSVTQGSTADLVSAAVSGGARISNLYRVSDDLEEIYHSYFKEVESHV